MRTLTKAIVLTLGCLMALTILADVVVVVGRGIAAGAYTPNTVDFAGGNTVMTNKNPSWPVSGNTFAVSFWMKPDAAEAGTTDGILVKSDDGIRIFLTSGDKLRIDCEDATSTTLVISESTSSITRDGNTWTHIFYRLDRTVDNQAEMYVNGTLDTTGGSTFLSTGEDADPIDFDGPTTAFAALDEAASLPYAGCFADFWFNVDITYANLTVGDFISGGDPVDLGATGTNPDGVQPLIFLKGSGSGFNVNSGTLGNFTHVGTALGTCSTTP